MGATDIWHEAETTIRNMKTQITSSSSVLKKALLYILPILFSASVAQAVTVINPGDTVYGGQKVGSAFEVGTAGYDSGVNNWPGAEAPEKAIDGVGQKYLNFAKEFSGLVITPSFGASVVNSLKIWTANDATPRDPASYELHGTTATLSGSSFDMADFSLISAGALALPNSRNSGGSADLLDDNSQTINFSNSTAYTSYMILFPTVKDSANANSMQIAEVQLYGEAGRVSVPDTGSTMALFGLAFAGLIAVRRKLS